MKTIIYITGQLGQVVGFVAHIFCFNILTLIYIMHLSFAI